MTTAFTNISDLFQQAVQKEVKPWFEDNAPTYNALQKNVEIEEITEKGYRIPGMSERAGGHTAWLPSNSSFNAAKAPQSQSMYVFPVGYALPIILQGTLIRALNRRQGDALINFQKLMEGYTKAATKRINQMSWGDGSGCLAVSSSTLSSTGAGQTMNCTTAAAATPGETKGAKRLEVNQYYQAINTSTGAVRGTILVTTAGSTSCVVNVISGSVSSGDYIVDVGAYNRYMRGLAHLFNSSNRTLQGLNTANNPDLNCSGLDLQRTLTPADWETLKSLLHTRNNEDGAENMLSAFITYGQHSNLRKQGYGMRQYMGDDDTVRGVSKKFVDGDTTFHRDADGDEDCGYLIKNDQVKMFEEMPFGDYNLDGQELRMLLGSNSTGSDDYQKAIGCRSQMGILMPKSGTFFKRASITGVTTQATA